MSLIKNRVHAGSSLSAPFRDPDLTGIDRRLLNAVIDGNVEQVRTALANGANANTIAATNLDCWQPLHYAARDNQANIARALLTAGAQLEAKSKDGETPLHLASAYGSAEAVVLLLVAGAAATQRNQQGRLPLDLAGTRDRLSVSMTTIPAVNTVSGATGRDAVLTAFAAHAAWEAVAAAMLAEPRP